MEIHFKGMGINVNFVCPRKERTFKDIKDEYENFSQHASQMERLSDRMFEKWVSLGLEYKRAKEESAPTNKRTNPRGKIVKILP